eukprot:1169196_1
MHYKHQFEPTKRTPSKPNMYFFKTQYQKMPRHLKEAIGAVGVPGYTTEKMAKNGFLSAFQIWRLQWSVPNLDKDICRFTNKRADKRKIPQWKTICVPLLFMVLIIKLIMGLYIYPQVTKRDFIKHVAKVGPKHLAKIYLENHAKWVSRVKGKNHSASETKTILKQRFAPQGIACVYKEKNMKQKYHFKKNSKAFSNRVINQ